MAFVIREQAQPGPGFDLLYARYLGPVHERIAALVAVATGRDPTADSVLLDTHALVGMALGFVVARATLLRRLARPAYTPADVNAIAARVAELATTALGPRVLNPPSAGARARRAALRSAKPQP